MAQKSRQQELIPVSLREVTVGLITADFLDNVTHFQVGDISPLSDHCPLLSQLSTESGSTFCLRKLNLHSGELLQEIPQRVDPEHSNIHHHLTPITTP